MNSKWRNLLQRVCLGKRKKVIRVCAVWDDEAGVWCATSGDVHGLAIEAESKQKLRERLRIVIPELLKLNHADSAPIDIQSTPVKLTLQGSQSFALTG